MADTWVKMEKHTPEKPEILAIAARLSIDPEVVFTKCFKVWRWADSMTANGQIPRVDPASLDALVHTPHFADALREVGWLQARDGALVIPNFKRHMGQSAKRRAMDAQRKASARCPQNVRIKSGLEKRREEKSKDKTPLPPSLDSPEFVKAWNDWKAYRVEIGKTLKPRSEEAQLKHLAAMGSAAAILAIEQSIRAGWQGLFPPKDGSGKAPVRQQVFDPTKDVYNPTASVT